ncbi:MAG: hypothetical protein K940chlam2_01645, partial [Chlamydiae bacterium]|nr:hypothetical protein [Chlamydiota bacterium]
ECLVSYFKRLGQNFVAMFGALWDLLQVIFCCKLHQELDWDRGWKLPPDAPTNIMDTLEPLNDGERRNIFFVIHTIANTNLLKLWPLETELTEKGDAIDHVHPFRFFEYALSHPLLKEDLKKLSESYVPIVWNSFTGGLSRRFARAKVSDDIAKHLVSFSKTTGVAATTLQPLIDKEDWKGFIQALVSKS